MRRRTAVPLQTLCMKIAACRQTATDLYYLLTVTLDGHCRLAGAECTETKMQRKSTAAFCYLATSWRQQDKIASGMVLGSHSAGEALTQPLHECNRYSLTTPIAELYDLGMYLQADDSPVVSYPCNPCNFPVIPRLRTLHFSL